MNGDTLDKENKQINTPFRLNGSQNSNLGFVETSLFFCLKTLSFIPGLTSLECYVSSA